VASISGESVARVRRSRSLSAMFDLIALGANASMVIDSKKDAFHSHNAVSFASSVGDIEGVDVLLQALSCQAVVESSRCKEQLSPKELLTKALNTRIAAASGGSALHLAAGNGHASVCQRLLHHGCDAWQLDDQGRTPIHLACQFGKCCDAQYRNCGVSLINVYPVPHRPS